MSKCMASICSGFYVNDPKTAGVKDRCNEPAPWAIGDEGLIVWVCKKHYDLATAKPRG
jgi:hypothetical protein